MPRPSPVNLAWLAAYVAMIVSVVVSLRSYRASAIQRYGSPQAAAEWQQWREAAEELGKSGPVHRERPKSTEPPALLLMRNYFGVCLAISLLISSVLFLTLMLAIRGAAGHNLAADPDRPSIGDS